MSEQTTILLADDQQAITDNLAPFLERSGFNVQAASAGDSDVFTPPGRGAVDLHLVNSEGKQKHIPGDKLHYRRRWPEYGDNPEIVLTKETNGEIDKEGR